MKQHFLYGPEATELGWVPAPRYLLRRQRVFDHLGEGKGRELLDIGCGAGALISELASRGFHCTGLETSEQAQKVARALNSATERTRIVESAEPDWERHFDVILALEVLEHIEDDHGALGEWRRWLKSGGLCILSVPCHMEKWGPSDEWAGHVRRYEDDEFRNLIESQDLKIEAFENYGFPLMPAVDAIRRRHYSDAMQRKAGTTSEGKSQNTAESGVDRTNLDKIYSFCKTPVGLAMMAGALQLQKMFLNGSRGDGFLVVARAP